MNPTNPPSAPHANANPSLPSIERLVGEFRVRERREIVTLYQVDDLIAGDHALLFIAVQSKVITEVLSDSSAAV